MIGQPCRRRRGFPIRQNVDDAPQSPDADRARLIGWLNSTTPDDA
jgi:hypothetical protein